MSAKPESKWSADKLGRLFDLLSSGVSVSSCAIRFQTTHDEIKRQLGVLKAAGRIPYGYRLSNKELWTPEKTARLIELVKSNMSRIDIAYEMGLTKGMVSGRVHRLQLKGLLPQNTKGRGRPKRRAKRRSSLPDAAGVSSGVSAAPKVPHYSKTHAGGTSPPPTLKDRIARAAERQLIFTKITAGGIGEKLIALGARQCRYIHGDTTEPDCYFCTGEQVSGSPYCVEHTELCYREPEPRGAKRGPKQGMWQTGRHRGSRRTRTT